MTTLWPWLTLALLGAYHGINPAMGWLFAVALGLQERSRSAVLRAFAPIALGHAGSVALVVALLVAMQALVPEDALRIAGGVVVLGFGLFKLLIRTHPRWVGMRIGFRDLTAWSFLMSTAHGAGLMLAPVLLRLPAASLDQSAQAAHAQHAQSAAHADHLLMAGLSGGATSASLAAVGLHTLAMFLVMALVALVVYEKVGLAILRRAWVNLDLVWAGALVLAGAITIIVS